MEAIYIYQSEKQLVDDLPYVFYTGMNNSRRIRSRFEIKINYKIPSENKTGSIRISGPEPGIIVSEDLKIPYPETELWSLAQAYISKNRGFNQSNMEHMFSSMFV